MFEVPSLSKIDPGFANSMISLVIARWDSDDIMRIVTEIIKAQNLSKKQPLGKILSMMRNQGQIEYLKNMSRAMEGENLALGSILDHSIYRN